MEMLTVNNKNACQTLHKGSALTFEGLALSDDNVASLKGWVEQFTKFTNERLWVISGEQMNRWYRLTGDNAYPDDLNIVCIDLNDLKDPLALALPRLSVGGRWLDDVVDNNLARERRQRRSQQR